MWSQQNGSLLYIVAVLWTINGWMAVITGTKPTGQGQSKDWSNSRKSKSYWWQPMIASPVTLQKMKEPQTAVSPVECTVTPWLTASTASAETISASLGWMQKQLIILHSTISMPHWWAPTREKQLSVALPSFVGWLGRWSLVALNRTSVPWPWISRLIDLGQLV